MEIIIFFRLLPLALFPGHASLPVMGMLRRIMALALILGMIGAAYYVRSESFSQQWRALVIEQFEKRQIYIDLDKLSFDPFSGVVASGIRIYHDEDHRILLGEINRLNLDLDYGKMLRKESFIEGIDLQDADVRFPIDYDDPKSEIINIKDAYASVVLMGDRIEVRRTSSTLFGLRVHVSGTLLRQRPNRRNETEEQKEQRRRQRLAAIRARRNLIIQVAQGLRHFESAQSPTLEVEVNGDLEEPEAITATMRLAANGLRHRNYVCENLVANATYTNETLDISRIHVRDHLGEIESSATWKLGSPHLNLHLQSTADLPGFAAALLQNEMLREVVFYEPPDVVAEGKLLIGKAVPEGSWIPFEGLASIRAGRLATRGEVLESVSMNVGLTTDGCYIRDGQVSHKSGTTTFQAMWRHGHGMRYQAVVQMDPRVILPFVKQQKFRETLQQVQMTPQSHFFLDIEGESEGQEIDFKSCHSKGHFDLRNMVFRGVHLEHLTGDLDITGTVQTFSNLKLNRQEGVAAAAAIQHDLEAKKITFQQIDGTLNLAEVVSCFNQKIAANIEKYRSQKAPQVEIDGHVFYRNPGTDLVVKFNSPGGSAIYPFNDKEYLVNSPAGTLHFKDGELDFKITGNYQGGPISCIGRTVLKSNARDFQFDLKAASLPHEVFGKQAPFKKVAIEVVSKNHKSTYNVKANLFAGTFTAKGQADHLKEPMSYNGEIMINALSFREFAKVYSPSNDTAGDLTGHMKFTGVMGDWRALRGEGALTILNSNLYAVPILGPLTPLIAAVLPRPMKGYNEAREADCTFTVANGFATTKNIEAVTGVFRLVSKGSVDFLENRIQFEAQARFRGLPGIVFFPVSEIFEYVAEGSVGDPLWRPRYFSNSHEQQEFRRPDELPLADLPQGGDAAQKKMLNSNSEVQATSQSSSASAKPNAGATAPSPTNGQLNSSHPNSSSRRSLRQKATRSQNEPATKPSNPREINPFNKPGSPIRIGR